MTKKQALKEIQEVLDRTANEMLLTEEEEAFTEWKRDSRVVLRHIFGENSDEVDEFVNIRYGLLMYTNFTTQSDIISARLEGIKRARAVLQSMMKQITKYGAVGIAESEESILTEVTNISTSDKVKAQNIRLLQEMIDEGKQLIDLPPLDLDLNRMDAWRIKTQKTIAVMLSPSEQQDFENIDFSPSLSTIKARNGVSIYEQIRRRKHSALKKATAKLEAWLWNYTNLDANEINLSTANDTVLKNMPTNKVFIVHGHDELIRHKVRTFLTTLGLDPVILQEQASGGKTIIKKFEAKAKDVSFAVILLTADDEGRKKSTEQWQSRARQNVIFELGYFSHALGDGKVFCLRDNGVDIPSDYSGVVYETLDEKGSWGSTLLQELQEAGMPIKAENIIQALQAIK